MDDFPVFGTDKENKFDEDVFKINNNILIVDQDRDGKALEQANKALSPFDRRLAELKRTAVGEGDYQYSLIFCRVEGGDHPALIPQK